MKPKTQNENTRDTVSFWQWRGHHQTSMVLIVISLITAIALGMANIYTTLVASGEPIFLEQPWLALCLSGLVPAGATALKFVSNFFDYTSTKRLYTLVIYVLVALFLLLWGLLFALTFDGVSGGIDWDTLGDSSGKGWLLVFVQIVAEILVATALFLSAEEIYLHYAPETYIENLAYLNAAKALREHLAAHERLCKERNEAHGALIELNAARQTFINERIAEFLTQRARYDAAKNF